jgi:hypothetical protein
VLNKSKKAVGMENRQIRGALVLFILFGTIFYSCNYHCNCDKYLGCKIISARKKSNDSLLALKTYCAQTNYYTDKVLQDSVKAFTDRYNQQGAATIIEVDSIYSHEYVRTKGGKQAPYIADGYDCLCPR